MTCEDVFVFETEEEAKKAAEELEFNPDKSKNELQAWWHGRESFLRAVEEYENNLPSVKVLVHWL